ncbi:hypothetical protein Bca52824_075868 [Brassica carinata]|uniref:Uncharacterized protein n=1 Tax=Brassica carinata TaxID=52824 RepID=A0A8X7TWR7_BRACI|nr:hypothetical protein Bca52824_075868 [Brassica carinata]
MGAHKKGARAYENVDASRGVRQKFYNGYREKVGHKKVECFAREKSETWRKVNKTLTKPKRVEEVSLAKSGLLDEIG